MGGGGIYVLDITPLVRSFPFYAQLGLDPRLSSTWNGVGDTEGHRFSSTGQQCSPCDTVQQQSTIGSSQGPPTPWEAEILGGPQAKATDYWPPHTCNETPYAAPMCSIQPLRWHRVAGAEGHVHWTEEGLHIVVGEGNTGTTRAIPDFNDFTDSIEGSIASPAVPYAGPPNTEWASADGQGLRYPLLVHNYRGASTQTSAVTDSITAPIGRGPRMGHLGASAMYIHGGALAVSGASTTLVLELWATYKAPSIQDYQLQRPGQVASGAYEPLPNNVSAALDDGVVFWGLWGEMEEDAGPSPPAIQGSSYISLPSCKAPGQFDLTSFFSSSFLQPLATSVLEEAASLCSFPNTSPSPLPPLEPTTTTVIGEAQGLYSSFRLAWSAPELLLADAVTAWQEVAQQGLFGPRAQGYDFALMDPGGFALWPGVSARNFYEITHAKVKETLLLLLTGCKFPFATSVESIVCM